MIGLGQEKEKHMYMSKGKAMDKWSTLDPWISVMPPHSCDLNFLLYQLLTLPCNVVPLFLMLPLLAGSFSSQILSTRSNLFSNTWHSVSLLYHFLYSSVYLYYFLHTWPLQPDHKLPDCKIRDWFIFAFITHITTANNNKQEISYTCLMSEWINE